MLWRVNSSQISFFFSLYANTLVGEQSIRLACVTFLHIYFLVFLSTTWHIFRNWFYRYFVLRCTFAWISFQAHIWYKILQVYIPDLRLHSLSMWLHRAYHSLHVYQRISGEVRYTWISVPCFETLSALGREVEGWGHVVSNTFTSRPQWPGRRYLVIKYWPK